MEYPCETFKNEKCTHRFARRFWPFIFGKLHTTAKYNATNCTFRYKTGMDVGGVQGF